MSSTVTRWIILRDSATYLPAQPPTENQIAARTSSFPTLATFASSMRWSSREHHAQRQLCQRHLNQNGYETDFEKTYSFGSVRRDIHNTLLSTALQSQYFIKVAENLRELRSCSAAEGACSDEASFPPAGLRIGNLADFTAKCSIFLLCRSYIHVFIVSAEISCAEL